MPICTFLLILVQNPHHFVVFLVVRNILSQIVMIFFLHLAGNENSIAESLLLLLDSFPEPVIPFAMHLKCLDSAHNYTACKQVRLIINELVLFSILPTKVEVCIFHF